MDASRVSWSLAEVDLSRSGTAQIAGRSKVGVTKRPSKVMYRRALALTASYWLVGASVAAVADLATGVGPFGSHLLDSENLLQGGPELGKSLEPVVGRQVARVPDIVIGYLFARFLIGIVVTFALLWATTRSASATVTLALGISIPLIFEILFSRPFAHSWVGGALAVLMWPDVPEYVMDPDLVVRVAIGHLAPAFFAGLAVSLWLIRQREASVPSTST